MDKALDHVARKILKQKEEHRAITEAAAIVEGFERILPAGPPWKFSRHRVRAVGRRITISMEREVADWLLQRARVGLANTPKKDPLIAFSDAVHGDEGGAA